jgi:hypothetical protein
MVVTQDNVPQLQAWLADAKVHPTNVLRVDGLAAFGIPYTPTVFIMDSSGVITDIAARALSTDEEAALFRRVQGDVTARAVNIRSRIMLISADDIDEIRYSEGAPIFIDPQSVRGDDLVSSIPLPSADVPVVVDCRQVPFSHCVSVGEQARKRLRPEGIYAIVN